MPPWNAWKSTCGLHTPTHYQQQSVMVLRAMARAVLVLVVMVVLLHPLLLRKRRSRLIKCWI